MGKDRKPLGTLAVVALAAILLSAVALAVDVDAARGGKGKGGGPNGGAYTLSVSPNPAPYGTSAFVFTGTGYAPNSSVRLSVSGMLCCGILTTQSDGSFSHTWNRVLMPGTYTTATAVPKGNDWTLGAQTTFTVTP